MFSSLIWWNSFTVTNPQPEDLWTYARSMLPPTTGLFTPRTDDKDHCSRSSTGVAFHGTVHLWPNRTEIASHRQSIQSSTQNNGRFYIRTMAQLNYCTFMKVALRSCGCKIRHSLASPLHGTHTNLFYFFHSSAGIKTIGLKTVHKTVPQSLLLLWLLIIDTFSPGLEFRD